MPTWYQRPGLKRNRKSRVCFLCALSETVPWAVLYVRMRRLADSPCCRSKYTSRPRLSSSSNERSLGIGADPLLPEVLTGGTGIITFELEPPLMRRGGVPDERSVVFDGRIMDDAAEERPCSAGAREMRSVTSPFPEATASTGAPPKKSTRSHV